MVGLKCPNTQGYLYVNRGCAFFEQMSENESSEKVASPQSIYVPWYQNVITPPELHLHEDQHGRKGRGGKESSEKWVREERKNARESGGEIELVLVQQKLETAASKDINTVLFYCVLRLRATSGHWWFLFLVCVSHVVKAPLFLILVYMLLSWQRGGIRLGKRP